METSKNLFGFEQIETNPKIDSILLFEGIRKEVEGYLLEQSDDTDSNRRSFPLYDDNDKI